MHKEDQQPWFVRKRAEALALLVLTDRHTFHILRPSAEHAVDFLVEVTGGGRGVGGLFGVQVSGTLLEVSPGDTVPRPRVGSSNGSLPPALPVVLLVFNVGTNAGFYTWTAEPVVTEAGAAKLTVARPPPLAPVDRKALDTIARRVSHWHAALLTSLAV